MADKIRPRGTWGSNMFGEMRSSGEVYIASSSEILYWLKEELAVIGIT
jgi:hypothetical protein